MLDSKLIICDLRKKEDFSKGHIKKSVLVKFDEKNLIDVPPDSKIVLVGYDDIQSKRIMSVLRRNNIDAYYLIDGIKGWHLGLYCTNISYVGTGYP